MLLNEVLETHQWDNVETKLINEEMEKKTLTLIGVNTIVDW